MIIPRIIIGTLIASGLSVGLAISGLAYATANPAPAAALKQTTQDAAPQLDSSTADHTKFEALQADFKSGPEVTKACLSCHTEAAKQIHKTKHWTWEYKNPDTGQVLGKKHVINNFCTAVASNEDHCSACHIGYGWADKKFDFTVQENVDCLVCHDTTGVYKKLPGLAGHPNYETMEWPPKSGRLRPPTDLKKVAQNVGKTSRKTCGACHFRGGGGDAVKHGDLDSSLENPKRYLDVHMDTEGLNFACAKCHVTDAHEVPGSRYGPTASDTSGAQMRGSKEARNPATCQACHGNTPHDSADAKLNDHTHKIACQTCHVPAYARGPRHTKMSWDWSTAGRLDEQGKRIRTRNSVGKVEYDSNKGHFTYDRYVIPEYKWVNGKVKYTLFGDKVDGSSLVKINEFLGGPDDPDSRIWPLRVFRGKQMYDKGLQTLAVLHTTGNDDTAFWKNYDWDKALATGMKAVGAEYSGSMGFVETEMSWPITHMVAPKEDALKCEQCHTKGGRLAGIEGVYVPARDRIVAMDTAGFSLALLALISVLIHGAIRMFVSSRKRG